MKKFYLLIIGLVSFIGISTVKADTLNMSNFYDYFDTSLDIYFQYENIINNIISYYESNYQSNYPYYYVTYRLNSIYLVYSNSSDTHWDGYSLDPNVIYLYPNVNNLYGCVGYDISSNTYFYERPNGYDGLLYYGSSNTYNNYDTGNLTLINHGFTFNNVPSTWSDSSGSHISDFDIIEIPSFTSSEYNFSISSFQIEDGDLYPGILDLYNSTYQSNIYFNYREINLNNYSYVALSLKDYTQDSFSTNIFTKGQLCITPVYDYGMKEKTDYYSGYQVQGCTSYYNDFTPVRTYITEQDLQHNAIYYVKAYDTTRDNIIKVDTSLFNIALITSENADNPIININGRNYTTIPYSELSSTSTQSEEEGYISGESVNFIDSISNSTSDLFSNPLKVLKGVWGAIVSMLTLIATFIGLLPPTMQAFLYMAFSIAIILGIIKILL